MCLGKVTATHSKPSGVIVDGWKSFTGTDSALTFQQMGGPVTLDVWLQASKIKPPQDIVAGDGTKYRAGFHAYGDEQERGCYRRVYLRNITCTGEQDFKKCVIAQEMYVPSDKNAWPPQEQSQPSPSPPPAPKKRLLSRLKKGGAS
jgi:hypothetical protein